MQSKISKFQSFKTLAEEDGGDGGKEKRREGFQLFMEKQLLEGQVSANLKEQGRY